MSVRPRVQAELLGRQAREDGEDQQGLGERHCRHEPDGGGVDALARLEGLGDDGAVALATAARTCRLEVHGAHGRPCGVATRGGRARVRHRGHARRRAGVLGVGAGGVQRHAVRSARGVSGREGHGRRPCGCVHARRRDLVVALLQGLARDRRLHGRECLDVLGPLRAIPPAPVRRFAAVGCGDRVRIPTCWHLNRGRRHDVVPLCAPGPPAGLRCFTRSVRCCGGVAKLFGFHATFGVRSSVVRCCWVGGAVVRVRL